MTPAVEPRSTPDRTRTPAGARQRAAALYTFDCRRADGSPTCLEAGELGSDDHAIAWAGKLLAEHPTSSSIEIFDGERLVGAVGRESAPGEAEIGGGAATTRLNSPSADGADAPMAPHARQTAESPKAAETCGLAEAERHLREAEATLAGLAHAQTPRGRDRVLTEARRAVRRAEEALRRRAGMVTGQTREP